MNKQEVVDHKMLYCSDAGVTNLIIRFDNIIINASLLK